jgi:hypothetical protein
MHRNACPTARRQRPARTAQMSCVTPHISPLAKALQKA